MGAAWLWLSAAILLEVAGTTCMKLSEGFARPLFGVAMLVLYVLSFSALTLVLRHLSVSVAYAAWSGLGTALIATIGVLWFREPVSALKIVSLLLIILGVIGLNLGGGAH